MVVRRAHTTANIAPAIRKLREQVDAAYPKRDRTSDGIWPSKAHSKQNPNSDHEAGNALDIDRDLSATVKVTHAWLDGIRRDVRCSYVIFDGKIGNAAGWSRYVGSNPHKTHAHVSIHESKRGDTRAWGIGPAKPAPQKEAPVSTRHFAAATIVDMGDAAHRAALKALAVKWQDKIVEGAVSVQVHAETGANLDAYIVYAQKNALEMHSITDGAASSMVVRSTGRVPTTNADAIKLRSAVAAAHRVLGEAL